MGFKSNSSASPSGLSRNSSALASKSDSSPSASPGLMLSGGGEENECEREGEREKKNNKKWFSRCYSGFQI
jgi:hypothetical protein